jgi:hypothetical protein
MSRAAGSRNEGVGHLLEAFVAGRVAMAGV